MHSKLTFFSGTGSAVTAKIFKAMLTVGGLSLIVRAVDALIYLLAAALFGAGDEMDALLIALIAPVFLLNIFSGAFHTSFIPAYIKVRNDHGGPDESERVASQRFFASVMMLGAALLIVLTLALSLSGSYLLPIFGSGFNPLKLQLTRSLFFILIPTLLFSSLARMWAAVLNAAEKFKLAALSPAIKSIILIGFLLTMAPYWGIYAFAWGMAIGSFVEMILLADGIRRQNLPVWPRWHGMSADLKQVLRQFAPMAAGSILMGGTELIDHSMAAMLGPGSVSTLSYANKIVMFVLVVSSGALGTAVFPYFSQMAANQDRRGIIDTLKIYSRLIILFSLPATALLYYFSQPLVRILFERGAFTIHDTQQISTVVGIYAFQITFYLLSIMEVRLISALRGNHILMVSTMISLPLNILFNYIFMHFMGVAGIALSTVLVYLLAFVFLTVMLFKMMAAFPQ
ncbi:lipid II flippase MurJ [Desulfococcaceae bacterium HSG7]|nr:lipid II flippase MurJ [Desulfococcaceae bacterium HSG7]